MEAEKIQMFHAAVGDAGLSASHVSAVHQAVLFRLTLPILVAASVPNRGLTVPEDRRLPSEDPPHPGAWSGTSYGRAIEGSSF